MSEFYAGKSVVVTGGAGMIGHQLVKKLSALGCHVIVMDDNSRGHNIVNRPNVQYAFKANASRHGSCEWCFRGLSTQGDPVWAVFNLAASVAGVFHNQDNNVAMFNQNVLLQTVPVEVAEYVGVPNFLQVSSVCVYDPGDNHPSSDRNSLHGEPHMSNYGYAMAKRMGEDMVRAARLNRAVTVRPSNVYGPKDYFDEKAHVIPALIRRILAGGNVEIYSPTFIREFIYSEDVADGMIAALEHGRQKSVYNLGWSGDERSTKTIMGLAKMIKQISGSDATLVPVDGRPGGEASRWSDSSKAYEELEWQPKVALGKGLETVIKQYVEELGE